MKPTPSVAALASLTMLLLLTQCHSPSTLPGPAGRCFPSVARLQEGIAHKYYFHYQPDGAEELSTNVIYRTFQLTGSNTLVAWHFNTDFSPIRYREYEVRAGHLLMLEDIQYYQQDTFKQRIVQSEFRNWQSDTSTLIKYVDYGKQSTWAITASLTEWEPAIHRGEPADAYAYLTYKLKDGELVELLP